MTAAVAHAERRSPARALLGEGIAPRVLGADPQESAGGSPEPLLRFTGTTSGGPAGVAPTGPPLLPISLASPFPLGAAPMSAEQLRTDALSRTAFSNLARPAAVALAKRTFQTERPAWSPAGSESGTRVTRYLGTYTASEERPGGRNELVQSTVPLQVEASPGHKTPVSLTLRDQGSTFVPANAVVPISIAKDVASGVSFDSGVTVAPAAANASEAPEVVGDQVMFANTAKDTDFMVEPLPGGTGAELSWQLRSQDSPQENALVFALPLGASLQMSAQIPGGAEVRQGDQTLLTILPASARGADGTPLPVTYTVSGDTLVTHIDLSGNVDFPVLVDPEILGNYGTTFGVPSWPGWGEHTNDPGKANPTTGECELPPGFCFKKEPSLIQVGTNPGAPVNAYAEWYTGVAASNAARITRVDIRGAIHEPANQSSFQAGIVESNGSPVYSLNGLAGANGPSPYVTPTAFSGQSIAFCANGNAGGKDGGSPGLCSEGYGGTQFFVGDDVWESKQTVFNYVRISGAEVHYIQSQAPTISTATNELNGWFSATHSPWISVEGKDAGLGVYDLGVDAVAGEQSQQTMEGLAGSKPAPGWPTYSKACEDPFCWASLGQADYISASQLQTGTSTLGAWTRNAVGLLAEKTYTIHVDNTGPEIETPSWNKSTFGDGSHALSFSATDGSPSAPQSGVAWEEVEVDGRAVHTESAESKGCPKPEGANLIPSVNCIGLAGSWTLEGEDYAAGPHTITIKAQDWAGNWSERSFEITIVRPAGETQQIGPGTVNLLTGDYQLGATDVSLSDGTASLAISRSYDSRSGASGPLGPGWTLSTPDASAGGQWQGLEVLPNGVEAMTTTGERALFIESGGTFTSPKGFQTYTLTEPKTSPATYRITDSGGDYTQFTEPSGASTFMPTAVAQAVGAGGLNAVTYALTKGKTTEILGPPPPKVECPAQGPGEKAVEHLPKGCRALVLEYASTKTATGENRGQWKDYPGRLKEVLAVADNPSTNKMEEIPVAHYAYDTQGRLRAEWDPRLSESLETTYGYDAEDHLTALTPPGQESWAFSYGTIASDPATGRLLKVTQAPASAALWNGEAPEPTKSEPPTLSGSAVPGITMGVSTGKWSNEPVAYTYRWEDCNSAGEDCTPIVGATNPNYKVTKSDAGHALVAAVTATNGDGSVAVSSAASSLVPTETVEYALPSGSHPYYITQGPNGTGLWYTDARTDKIGKIATTGEHIEYALPSGSLPRGITQGPDGNLWFTEQGTSRIGKITTSGSVTEYALPSESSPIGITQGPDGSLWFTDEGTSRIGKITTSGSVTEYALPAYSGPFDITQGPDGNLWFTDWASDRIGKITTSGVVNEYPLLEGDAYFEGLPLGITSGPDGNLWYTDDNDYYGTSRIGKITTSGRVTEYALPSGSYPFGITQGPDGNLWYTDSETSKIGKITTSGEHTEYAVPTESRPDGIADGPDGNLWYADNGASKIGKITTSGTIPESAEGTEGTRYGPQPGSTIEYNVPLSGTGLPTMTKSEVERWAQKEDPAEATAIFPRDEPQSWPATDYRRASVYYFDSADRLVNTATPGGGISTTEYDKHDNVERALTAGDRQRSLEAGGESVTKSEHLETKSTYSSDGTELLSSLGPEHEVKLASGGTAQARAHTQYSYDEEGAPKSETPYRLATTTIEGGELDNGEEVEKRTVKDSYAGQGGLGWTLHKPTSVTTEPQPGHTSTRTTVYNAETGDVVSSMTPAGSEAAPPPTYAASLARYEDPAVSLSEPNAVAVDPSGDIWVAEGAHDRIVEFNSERKFLRQLGSEGSGASQFKGIGGIASNSSGDIYVTDSGNNRVQEFGPAGEHIATFGSSSVSGGQLLDPSAIAIDSSGDVWVANFVGGSGDRVVEFSAGGTELGKFGSNGSGAGQIGNPSGLAISGGHLYVVEEENSRVQEFTTAGTFVVQFDEKGSGNGKSNKPYGIATEASTGDLYVTEVGNDRVQEFSAAGGFITSYGSAGSGAGQFSSPKGLAVSSSGTIYIADVGNNRLEQWAPGIPPTYTTSLANYEDPAVSLSEPNAVAVDPSGDILVAESGADRVLEFNPEHKYLRQFGQAGSAEGQFKGIGGIATNASDDIYVSDSGNNRVQEFSPAGLHLRTFGSSSVSGGQLLDPSAIAIDSSGDVWVANFVGGSGDRVVEFSAKGEELSKFGTNGSAAGQIGNPTGLAISGGNLYLVEEENSRVQEFTTAGKFERQFDEKGSGNGKSNKAYGIATEASTGDLYVTEVGNDRVQEFSPAGAFITSFGSAGSGAGQFSSPGGVAVNSAGDLYVADTGNNRAQEWHPANPAVHTDETIYYTPKNEASEAACQNHPEWANLPCRTQPAEQPSTSGLPKLPVTTTTYNIWDEVEKTEQTVGSEKRTTTVSFDPAGRPLKSSTISSTGKPQPTVTDTYSEHTGALIEQAAEGRTITSSFNPMGQLVSYTDADGNTSTYTYDVDGRPLTTNDGKGTQTYTYDKTTGDLTELVDSGARTFSATYNVEGQLEKETYPNGMTATHIYDSIGEATSLAYAKGSSTWYEDRVSPSIHGQWLSQQSTLSAESYAYDQLGRMTEAAETPQAKGCTTSLYVYDEDSNRTSETKRTSEGACATQGGTTTAHSYDEADRLTDPGTEYEPFGGATTVPAQDAGGHPLESKYYAGGALYSQSQNGQSNTYELDPAGRVRETTTVTSLESKSTISHYSGNGSSPAWTTTGGIWTRNIVGIGGGITATETQGKEAEIQLSNLHGDVIGTVKDNSGAQPTLTSEPTAFGVPTTTTPSKYSWLGSGGLQTEFSSGVAGGTSGVYVPQLGLHLEPAGLSSAAEQDPVNEYLANENEAEPTGTWSGGQVDAVIPPPVNTMVSREFWESEPWNKAPVNEPEAVPGEYDPEGLASYKRTMRRAQELINDAARGLSAGLLADLILAGAAEGGADYAAGLVTSAMNLEACVAVGESTPGKAGRWGTCYINETKYLGVPISARAEFCEYVETRQWGKKPHNVYYCTGTGEDVWGPWY